MICLVTMKGDEGNSKCVSCMIFCTLSYPGDEGKGGGGGGGGLEAEGYETMTSLPVAISWMR